MDTGTRREDHVKMKAETGWCSRDRGHQCLWVTAEAGGEDWTDSLWGLVTQPEEAIEDGNSVLPAALCQTPQTCPLVHPHPTHLQSGTTSHLQLRGCCPAPQPGTQPTPPTQFIKLLLQFILQMPPEPSFRTLPGGITTVLKCNSPLPCPAEWSKSF